MCRASSFGTHLFVCSVTDSSCVSVTPKYCNRKRVMETPQLQKHEQITIVLVEILVILLLFCEKLSWKHSFFFLCCRWIISAIWTLTCFPLWTGGARLVLPGRRLRAQVVGGDRRHGPQVPEAPPGGHAATLAEGESVGVGLSRRRSLRSSWLFPCQDYSCWGLHKKKQTNIGIFTNPSLWKHSPKFL